MPEIGIGFFAFFHNKKFCFSVTGNEDLIFGCTLTSDYLLSDAGENIQFEFNSTNDFEDNVFDEDFIPGYIKCQQQCIQR